MTISATRLQYLLHHDGDIVGVDSVFGKCAGRESEIVEERAAHHARIYQAYLDAVAAQSSRRARLKPRRPNLAAL